MSENIDGIINTIQKRELNKLPVHEKDALSQLAETKGFLEGKEASRENGNHLVLLGKFGGKEAVFKATRKPKFISRTVTEIYSLVNFEGKLDDKFTVPKIFGYGLEDKKYLWFVSEQFTGEFIDGNSEKDAKILADATLSVLRKQFEIPIKDEPRIRKIESGEADELLKIVSDLALEWSKNFDNDITDLRALFNSYPIEKVPTAPVHGDLVSRHVCILEDTLGIFDWELAGGAYFWGYEPAYVYHRLYTRDGTPELAEYYKGELVDHFSDEEKGYFDMTFKPMLAQRVIGGYLDYKDKNSTEYELNSELERTLLSR